LEIKHKRISFGKIDDLREIKQNRTTKKKRENLTDTTGRKANVRKIESPQTETIAKKLTQTKEDVTF
jgi:hypothetical protein